MSWTLRTGTANFSTSGSVTITEPSGAADGDMLLLFTVGDGTVTAPGGWTKHPSAPFTRGSSTFNIYYIPSRSGAPSMGFTFTGTYLEYNCHCFNGHDTVTPLDDVQVQANTSGTNPDPPSATATTTTDLAFAGGVNWDAGGNWATAPSGYTNIVRIGSGSDDMASSSKQLSASGAENPGAMGTGAGSSTTLFGFTVLIKPSGAIAGDLSVFAGEPITGSSQIEGGLR